MGNSVAEIDGTIIAWREKVNNDLVRLITIIKNWAMKYSNLDCL